MFADDIIEPGQQTPPVTIDVDEQMKQERQGSPQPDAINAVELPK